MNIARLAEGSDLDGFSQPNPLPLHVRAIKCIVAF